MFSGFSCVPNYLQSVIKRVHIYSVALRYLLLKQGKRRVVQSTGPSRLKDILNCTCLEGSLVMLCQQGICLCHVLKGKRKGWFTEPLVVFEKVSVWWETFVRDLTSELKLVKIFPRRQWRWKRVFKLGDRLFLKKELAQRTPVLCALERV